MPSATILERERTDAECPRLSPLNDYVYVRQERIPDKAGNFYLPDSTRKHKATRYGTVLAVGPGRLVCYKELNVLPSAQNLADYTSFCPCCENECKPVIDSNLAASASCPCGWKWQEVAVSHNPTMLRNDGLPPIPGCWITKRLPMSVRPGDRVAFPDFAGVTVFADTDPSLLLMREEEILAVIE
jgi:co-chaperonin GroES (HSP10)